VVTSLPSEANNVKQAFSLWYFYFSRLDEVNSIGNFTLFQDNPLSLEFDLFNMTNQSRNVVSSPVVESINLFEKFKFIILLSFK